MCWCAQLMIQCETRLASVLWRFQIKSTLHNSLFTMEFFSNLKKNEKRKTSSILDKWTLQTIICIPFSATHLRFWYNFFPQFPQRRDWQAPGIGNYLKYLVSIYDTLNFNFLRSFYSLLVILINDSSPQDHPFCFHFVCLVICLQVFTDDLVVFCGFSSIQHFNLIRLWWFVPVLNNKEI